jgi:hypothetical protein
MNVQDRSFETADQQTALMAEIVSAEAPIGDETGALTGATIHLISDDRRLHPRFSVGVPVRLRAQGADASTMVELSDVSFQGCRLCTLSDAQPPELDACIAFGFVLPGRKIALVKGHVVRRGAEGGVGVAIDRANVNFYEFLTTLAEGERDLGATPAPRLAAAG